MVRTTSWPQDPVMKCGIEPTEEKALGPAANGRPMRESRVTAGAVSAEGRAKMKSSTAMRLAGAVVPLVLLACCGHSGGDSNNGGGGTIRASQVDDIGFTIPDFEFIGTVQSMGPPPGIVRACDVGQLVQTVTYNVEQVVTGTFTGSTITVEHLCCKGGGDATVDETDPTTSKLSSTYFANGRRLRVGVWRYDWPSGTVYKSTRGSFSIQPVP